MNRVLNIRAVVCAAFAACPFAAIAALAPTGLACNGGDVMTQDSTPHAVACSGSWSGNDVQSKSELLAQRGDFNFAVTSKAANSFSSYLFDGGTERITSIDFSTMGVALNENGVPQGLSHASVHTPIPEPETYALMLAGFAWIGVFARRRMAQRSLARDGSG